LLFKNAVRKHGDPVLILVEFPAQAVIRDARFQNFCFFRLNNAVLPPGVPVRTRQPKADREEHASEGSLDTGPKLEVADAAFGSQENLPLPKESGKLSPYCTRLMLSGILRSHHLSQTLANLARLIDPAQLTPKVVS